MSRRILTNAQMREADRLTIEAGTPGIDLIRRAGRAVADVAKRMTADDAIAVLCGPGNNGGDGFVAAELLKREGRQVFVYTLKNADELSGDAALAAKMWSGPTFDLEEARDSNPALVIDALFGAGLSRPLDGVAGDLAELAWRRVLSVDVPSGIDGDTGDPTGSHFAADATVSFAAPKPAHVLEPGGSLCGDLTIADIGISDQTLAATGARTLENAVDRWRDRIRWPGRSAHKHTRGRLMCVTGGPSNTGAARLAARAGLRAGAGAVTLLSPPAAVLVNASHSTAVMVKAFDGAAQLAEAARSAEAVVIGPAAGLTPSTRRNALTLAELDAALVLDADALTVFEDDPAALFAALSPEDLLTPHAGEFNRLFPGVLEKTANKIEAARIAAERAGCVVLLKGADTVIADPGGQAVVNTHSSPFLATAGSGDVLAGLAGGLAAQGLAMFDAACAAAWIHGDVGRRLGPGLIAEDLVEAIPQALRPLYTSRA